MADIKVHWSFWLICIVTLIWNLMGCINFIMQMNPAALDKYPEAAKSLVANRPVWATGAFAIAVFIGALGDILLMSRKAIAYYLFIVSLLGVLITNAHTFQASRAVDIWIGSVMSVVVAVFLIWYTRRVKKKGWLNG